MALTPDQLNPRGSYCVISDPVLRASEVVSGRRLQQGFEDDSFCRFEPNEPLWSNHVRLHCGKFDLAVWRDPSRPELNTDDPVFPQTMICGTMQSSMEAEHALAKEIAEDAEKDWLRDFLEGACRSVKSLYAYHL